MKQYTKRFVSSILGWQVRRLRKSQQFIVIAVAGSIGKTSTKFAIASVLKQSKRVRFQEGNYNDIVSIPLVFFDLPMPSLFNPLAWLKTFLKIEKSLRCPYPYDIVIIEIGTDGPGQIAQFSRYIQSDISVLTAITPEHMEFFKDIEAVAREELEIASFSNQLFANTDYVDPKYLALLNVKAQTYAVNQAADYRLTQLRFHSDGSSFVIQRTNQALVVVDHTSIAEPQLYAICAAATVADALGISPESIKQGIASIKPVSGRMNTLVGFNQSMIIDDTYNASPEATKAALSTLYRLPSPQKIALLGNMNELGDFSPAAHREIGKLCNPKQLDLLVTLGPEANEFLAGEAEKNGCKVIRCTSPYQAGMKIKELLKPKAIVLIKGSQNGVFAEEATKILLAHPKDADQLVRQSKEWLGIKKKQFETVNY